jgi:hypothetical protein
MLCEALEQRALLAADLPLVGRTGDVVVTDLTQVLGGSALPFEVHGLTMTWPDGTSGQVQKRITPLGDWELYVDVAPGTQEPIGTLVFNDRADIETDDPSRSYHLGFAVGQEIAPGTTVMGSQKPPKDGRPAEPTELWIKVGEATPVVVTVTVPKTKGDAMTRLVKSLNDAIDTTTLKGQVEAVPGSKGYIGLKNKLSDKTIRIVATGDFARDRRFYFLPDTRSTEPTIGFLAGQYVDGYGGQTTVSLTALDPPANDGKLGYDLGLNLLIGGKTEPCPVVVTAAATADNASPADLAQDLVKAINETRGVALDAPDLTYTIVHDPITGGGDRIVLSMTGSAENPPRIGVFSAGDLRGFQGKLTGKTTVFQPGGGTVEKTFSITISPGISAGDFQVTNIGGKDPDIIITEDSKEDGKVTAADKTTVTILKSDIPAGTTVPDLKGMAILIESGAGSGQLREIVQAAEDGTKVNLTLKAAWDKKKVPAAGDRYAGAAAPQLPWFPRGLCRFVQDRQQAGPQEWSPRKRNPVGDRTVLPRGTRREREGPQGPGFRRENKVHEGGQRWGTARSEYHQLDLRAQLGPDRAGPARRERLQRLRRVRVFGYGHDGHDPGAGLVPAGGTGWHADHDYRLGRPERSAAADPVGCGE